MYPEENDSTINKIVNAESSFMTVIFKGQATDSIRMWPETTGTVTPLFLARKSLYYLPKFKWFEDLRPLNKDDIFSKEPEPQPSEQEAEEEDGAAD